MAAIVARPYGVRSAMAGAAAGGRYTSVASRAPSRIGTKTVSRPIAPGSQARVAGRVPARTAARSGATSASGAGELPARSAGLTAVIGRLRSSVA